MHPRISVSAICTFDWLARRRPRVLGRHGITHVGVSVAKLEAHGWDDGVARIDAAIARACGSRTSSVSVRSTSRNPAQWGAQRERLLRVARAAVAVGAECLVFTTGPAAPLAVGGRRRRARAALAPVLAVARARGVPFAIEHTNSLRVDVGFVHTLRDVVDLARRLDTGVCMEINACWAERGLAATIRDGVDRIRLVQVSDFAVGTLSTPNRLVPGDGDIPLERILGDVLDAGYAGFFDLELIGPRIDDEGYDAAIPRAVDVLGSMFTELGA